MAARLELPISTWLGWVHPPATPGQSPRWGFSARGFQVARAFLGAGIWAPLCWGLFCLARVVKPLCHPGQLGCVSRCVCVSEGLRGCCWRRARGWRGGELGGAPDSRLFAQILFQSPPPPCTCCVPVILGSWQLSLLRAPVPEDTLGSPWLRFLCTGQHLESVSLLHPPSLSFRLQLLICVFLRSRYRRSLGAASQAPDSPGPA